MENSMEKVFCDVVYLNIPVVGERYTGVFFGVVVKTLGLFFRGGRAGA